MTIEKVRELMGVEAQNLTDSQIQKIEKAARFFAEATYLLMEKEEQKIEGNFSND